MRVRAGLLAAMLGAGVLTIAGCEEEGPRGVTAPEPSPSPSASPSPAPTPSPTIEVVRTVITAHREGNPAPIVAWGLAIVPVMEGRQICMASTNAVFAKSSVVRPMSDEEFLRVFDDEIVTCPTRYVVGDWGWGFAGATCEPRGDTHGQSVYVKCFTFGTLFASVKPPIGPAGDAIFQVMP